MENLEELKYMENNSLESYHAMPQWWHWLHTRSMPVLGMGEEATGFISVRGWMSVLFSDLRK